ncbi:MULTISPECIES: D-alanyl-lipoteichoic acid biosynthesis protein DltD [Leuconostoc]|nr:MULTISPECIES: D-alanyl-lipoteichoic acid biosynthesis protein DltD [Leuconostoc]AEJ30800.1 D-alanyl transfer protein DltD [Leuconostoc sp. C2]QBR47905.1 D-alanyl-lipoteichoic acid biosynthesis protein DltD [Leuconostoc kimchii]
MKKRGLWWIFGPVLVAFILVGALFLAPFSLNHITKKDVREASVSFSKNVFKGEAVKTAAFNDHSKRYVPFFGSSELLRLDSMHPAILAEKYHRNYQPFLLGQAGTESLTHYLSMQEMTPALHKKQAVFIVSQQWFTKKDSKLSFPEFYSPLQTADWLRHIKKITPTDRFMARRLLQQSQIKDNELYAKMITKISHNKPLSKTDRKVLAVRHRMLLREDQLFSSFSKSSNWSKRVEPALKKLPEQDDNNELTRQATSVGKKQTSNNRFQIKNSFYSYRVKLRLKQLAGSQRDFDYRQSDEYADFQAVLAEFAKQHTDVLFIIQPVNQRWANYTGLKKEMYYQSVDKVKKQLTSQGFNHIADLSHQGNQNYFMQDTIHLGWNGWVAADQHIKPFLTQGYQPTNYHINNNYLSEDWQNLMPTTDNLAQFK